MDKCRNEVRESSVPIDAKRHLLPRTTTRSSSSVSRVSVSKRRRTHRSRARLKAILAEAAARCSEPLWDPEKPPALKSAGDGSTPPWSVGDADGPKALIRSEQLRTGWVDARALTPMCRG
jgi:hypothetical protein